MTQPVSAVEELVVAFQALPRPSQEQFLERIVTDAAIREEIEDLLDLAVAEERSREPVRPLEDMIAELRS